ncbi:ArsR/SmtB family transcription factor [Mumia sp. DW29H23]|uniref:ArsR/SmtB family transcription factor n=1 Tax=Mumia sp. DW29H23 TaxID=3421241 RepID=UPI003D6940B5
MSGSASPAASFAALGDETRWALLVRLGGGAASASTLAADLPISRQAVAKHLEVLREVGLVTSERYGREVRFRPLGAELSRLGRDLQRHADAWQRRLELLKRAAEAEG